MASSKDSSSPRESSFPQWQLDYESAMQETDHNNSLSSVSRSPMVLKVALEKLRNLKKDVSKF